MAYTYGSGCHPNGQISKVQVHTLDLTLPSIIGDAVGALDAQSPPRLFHGHA
ncbi:hypothetical protein AGR1B_Lc10124 [Agrobacterium fabacearum S56]|nr:hypothetical protein AGR1B_Lc10124 [Agrobacterium fabacearum S56]